MADMQPESKRMTIAEIEALYPSHWILIADPETDEFLRVISGRIVCASKDRDGIDCDRSELKSKHQAVHCTKKSPKDLRFLLWPFHLTSTIRSSP